MRVVVCGGGVVGACTAYFLSRRHRGRRGRAHAASPVPPRARPAASWRATGATARPWAAGPAQLRAPCRTRRTAGRQPLGLPPSRQPGACTRTLSGGSAAAPPPGRTGWAERATFAAGSSTAATTAQVHPARFTEAMMQAAAPARRKAAAGSVDRSSRSRKHDCHRRHRRRRAAAGRHGGDRAGAMVDRSVVRAAAARLSRVERRQHGARDRGRHSADALFVDLLAADGDEHAPEVFPRGDGTTYVCGLSSRQVLPGDPAAVAPDPGAARPCGRSPPSSHPRSPGRGWWPCRLAIGR